MSPKFQHRDYKAMLSFQCEVVPNRVQIAQKKVRIKENTKYRYTPRVFIPSDSIGM